MAFIGNPIAPTIEPVLRAEADGIGWSIWVVLSCSVALLLCRRFAPLQFRRISALLYEAGRHNMRRKGNTSDGLCGVVVFFIYLIAFALSYQYVLFVFSDAAQPGFATFSCTVAVLAAIYAVKFLTLKIWAFALDTQAEVKTQIQLHTSASLPFSAAALAFGVTAYFTESPAICCIIVSVWVLCFTAKTIKIFLEICFSSKLNLFNIFLYLCTLEIAPFAIIITMAVRFMQNGCIC